MLAELTHRCPLGCPYCSNPLALDKRDDELDTGTWMRVFKEAAGLGVLQVHLSGGEPGARRDLVEITASARDAGLYTNLITSGVAITTRTMRDLWEAGLDHVQVSIQDLRRGLRRSHRRLSRRVPAQACARRRDGAARPAAHHQPRGASRQHRAHRQDGRPRAGAEGRPDRDRACAVLRLGAEEPLGADADARAGRPRGRGGRRAAGAPQGQDRDRLRGAGLSRALSQALRRRLGPALAQRHALGEGVAVPRRGVDPGPRILERARAFAGGRLGRSLRPSTRSAAPTSCPSRARAASGGSWISAAAAARRSCSPATPAPPIRSATSRRPCAGGGTGGVQEDRPYDYRR